MSERQSKKRKQTNRKGRVNLRITHLHSAHIYAKAVGSKVAMKTYVNDRTKEGCRRGEFKAVKIHLVSYRVLILLPSHEASIWERRDPLDITE
jgi:hypothetical protein